MRRKRFIYRFSHIRQDALRLAVVAIGDCFGITESLSDHVAARAIAERGPMETSQSVLTVSTRNGLVAHEGGDNLTLSEKRLLSGLEV